MTEPLYVKRDSLPLLNAGSEVMVTSRVKGSENAPPSFFVTALKDGTRFEVLAGQGTDFASFPTLTTSSVLGRHEQDSFALTAAVAADASVYVLRCLSGQLAVTFVSPHEARMQFRSLGVSRV